MRKKIYQIPLDLLDRFLQKVWQIPIGRTFCVVFNYWNTFYKLHFKIFLKTGFYRYFFYTLSENTQKSFHIGLSPLFSVTCISCDISKMKYSCFFLVVSVILVEFSTGSVRFPYRRHYKQQIQSNYSYVTKYFVQKVFYFNKYKH